MVYALHFYNASYILIQDLDRSYNVFSIDDFDGLENLCE